MKEYPFRFNGFMVCITVFCFLLISSSASILAAPVLNPSNGNYYEFIEVDNLSWADAKAYAETLSYNGMPGHLATIGSKKEADFIQDNFRTLFSVGSPCRFAWLGSYQLEDSPAPDANWFWVTGGSPETIHLIDGWGWGQQGENIYNDPEPGDCCPSDNGEGNQENCMVGRWTHLSEYNLPDSDPYFDYFVWHDYGCGVGTDEGHCMLIEYESPAKVVPTLGEYGIMTLILLTAAYSIRVIKRRQA